MTDIVQHEWDTMVDFVQRKWDMIQRMILEELRQPEKNKSAKTGLRWRSTRSTFRTSIVCLS